MQVRHPAVRLSTMTGYVPLQTDLSWDLEPPVEYNAGDVLILNVSMANPGTLGRMLYLLGGLCTVLEDGTIGDFIPGTEFVVHQAEGTTYGVNNPDTLTIWAVPGGQRKFWECQFTFTMTDCFLLLGLIEMVGTEPDAGDTVRGGVSGLLKAPVPGMMETILPMMMMVMVIGMMAGMVQSMR